MTSSIENTSWLRQILCEVQLEQFYLKLRDELQVTFHMVCYFVKLILHDFD